MDLPHTPRITFRPVREGDVDSFTALDRDPAVLRFIARQAPTLEEQRCVVRACASPDGRWRGHGRPVAQSPTGDFLGWFGLMATSTPSVLELGYRLHQRFWGQGLATEGSLALLDQTFTTSVASAVEATTMAVNLASRRVMEKCGMTHVETFYLHFDDPLPGTEHGEVRYRLARIEWPVASRPRTS